MAEKKFTQKVGYDDLLDYDPVNGILKYGDYEFFAKDLIKPQTYQISYDDYKEAYNQANKRPGMIGAASNLYSQIDPMMSEKQIRKSWEKMLEKGDYSFQSGGGRPPLISGLNNIYGKQDKVDYGFRTQEPSLASIAVNNDLLNPGKKSQMFRSLKQLGPDSYEISDYAIPGDVDFVDKIAAKSKQIYNNASADRAILAQNQQDSKNRRQGAAANKLG